MNPGGTRFTTSDVSRHSAAIKFDLNDVVRKLVDLEQPEDHRQNIAMILDLALDLPKAAVDGQQIECVLLALFARSRKAIIEAERPHGSITVRTGLTAGKIRVSITDDGAADAPPKSEISFMRTPEEDINLTTCAEIVQDQAGQLHAWRSRHSAFTTIIMDLPVNDLTFSDT